MVTDRLEIRQISQLIEDQFPAVYREDGPILIEFVKAYYEWAETVEKSAYNEGRDLLKISDIDTTLETFLDHFKFTYLDSFPYVSYVDPRFLIKHVMDFYRTKGTIQSTKLFMKLLFGEDVEIYYPGQDVLKPSDSVWKRPEYLEVSATERTKTYIDKKIVGSVSGATAFVDSIVRKRISGKMIDIIYLSTVKGTFVTGETVSDDGSTMNAPIVIGSLTSFEIATGGRNNKIGDIFDVIMDGAAHGKIRVTETEDATGRVNFQIEHGGQGYTLDSFTQVYVSDTILSLDNPNLSFIDREEVYQRLEYIEILAAAAFNTNAEPGDTIIGVDSSNNVIGSGKLVVINPDGPLPTANGSIIVSPDSGSFMDQVKITVGSAPNGMQVGEKIDEETRGVMTVSVVDTPPSVGQKIEQFTYHPLDPDVITYYASAFITNISGSEWQYDRCFGRFQPGAAIVNGNNNAFIISDVNTEIPASARISHISGNDISLSDITGEFTNGYRVRTQRTRVLRTITAVTSQGASDLILQKNGNPAVVDITEDRTVRGIVIGQSETDVGIYGTSGFYVSNTYPVYIQTDRSKLLSPPRDANNNIIELKIAVTEKSTGSAATFQVGSIVNQQTVTINTDMLNGRNVADIPYMEIRLDGVNSGINKVTDYNIIDGGSQYTNGDIAMMSGGGYANSDPYMNGYGIVETDGNGTIVDIDPVEWGAGYFMPPVVVLPPTSGTAAVVEAILDTGYGFPKSPSGNLDSVMGDVLDFSTMTIGSIANMKRINPGINYNKNPYVRVINKSIAAYRRGNFVLTLTGVVGNFQTGEGLYQQVGPERFPKGTVISYEDGTLLVERDLFETDFNNVPIIGDITGSSGMIVQTERLFENIFGDNADISSEVISANGVITGVEVIDSGFGYMEGEGELVSNTNPFSVGGTVRLGKHGIGEGFWLTTTSHLNSEKKIHDNDYYQEFSYDVVSSISLEKYANILKNLTHVSGTKMFGSTLITGIQKIDTTQETEIDILPL